VVYEAKRSYSVKAKTSSGSKGTVGSLEVRTMAAVKLVAQYRQEGHNFAQVNPLTCSANAFEIPGFSKSLVEDVKSEVVSATDLEVSGLGEEVISLSELNKHLAASYCGPMSAQFTHLGEEERRFFAEKMETQQRAIGEGFSDGDRKHIHELLHKAEVFDYYLQKKFRTTKRYGLEGNEAMMVALDEIFDKSATSGVSDVVLTMLHRGRLNTLIHLLNYPMDLMVHKLKGNSIIPSDLRGHGDVLSHIDQHTDFVSRRDAKKKTHISFIPNPSHLESSAPVAMGKAYARQKSYAREQKTSSSSSSSSSSSFDASVIPPVEKDKVVCVMVHGDASVAGQGVIAETALLANLNHFSVGGSIHIVANNQLGFTAMAHEGRSWQYCTDVAKMLNVPVLHVSGEHPEHVAYATKIAIEYRNKFHKDVWIDIVGYRKHGHNELDEPSFTQPEMYSNIRARTTIPSIYSQQLIKAGIIKDQDQVEALRSSLDAQLEEGFQKHSKMESSDGTGGYVPLFDHLQGPKWSGKVHPSPKTIEKLDINPDTSFDAQSLVNVALASTKLPKDFTIHERLARSFVEARQAKLAEGVNAKDLDWATAEAMAFGSLLLEGHNIRLCGQDACRGTFSQRHAKLTDQKVQSKTWMPMNHIEEDASSIIKKNVSNKSLSSSSSSSSHKTGRLEVINSPLSEFAVMGFEYGHSIEDPNTLSIWEAQYGDFVNGAQIIIDQYISSGDDKWLRQSGLTLLLPHGYDGAGPEHSSCHLERFLQSSDTNMIDEKSFSNLVPNWSVMVPTTPANYFHALRRQLKRNYLRPLVIATPKQLLRDPLAVSPISLLTNGNRFQPVLSDPDHSEVASKHVRTVALMSGKIFYELRQQRKERKKGDIALVRVEELSPFPSHLIKEEIAKYPNATRVVWIQDEPQNMGSWSYVEPRLRNFCGLSNISLISPPPLASAAVGASVLHKKVTADLYDSVFARL
jgi:probable 2-oxoglutarate dehydrogenase E1 component DHKTD1